MHSLARFAMARGLLNPAEVNVLTELTNLRNRVVHQDDAVVTAESANRYAALALLTATKRKNIIHGLVEIDVTNAHRLLRQLEAAGEDLPEGRPSWLSRPTGCRPAGSRWPENPSAKSPDRVTSR